MTTQQTVDLAQAFLQIVEFEFETTRRVLAAVPDDKAGYKPDPASRSALDIAQHIATSDVWFLDSIAKGAFEFSEENRDMSVVPTASAAAAYYAEKMPGAIARVKAMSPEDLNKIVQFATFQLPNAVYIGFMMRHSIHHRGQLSAYLRAMGSKVPSIYGGSADEPFEMTANA